MNNPHSISTSGALFSTERLNVACPSITAARFESLWDELHQSYGLTSTQLIEAASYSMAMVVRYALGLSATGGRVLGLVDDCRAGWVALAALRHLANAGVRAGVIHVNDMSQPSPQMELQISILRHIGVPFDSLSEVLNEDPKDLISCFHNIICGAYRTGRAIEEPLGKFLSMLNDSHIPVHTIEAPLGLDVDSGGHGAHTLYASSTLSLGVPFTGLGTVNDFVGRHYVCDISIPARLATTYGLELQTLFAEQPVVRIHPAPFSL